MDALALEPIDNPTALRIIDAAAQLFLQRGYTAVSITDIIRAAEVTKPTMYYYFADKEELFLHTGLRVLSQMGAELQATLRTPGGVARRLHALAATMMRDRNRDMRLMRHEMFEHLSLSHRRHLAYAFNVHVFALIQQLMTEGLAHGELSRFPATTLTMMFMGMCESFMEFAGSDTSGEWSASVDSPGAPILTPDTLVDLFLHGAGGALNEPSLGPA
ncbi:MAG: TetR/AcrR family transcriptional regulator [Oscillochloris sp.]|nr:TetR/AcrR family transcriptional regulator [Oscillochloris sp.]